MVSKKSLGFWVFRAQLSVFLVSGCRAWRFGPWAEASGSVV